MKMRGSLMRLPNDHLRPRAIDHATCGPVQDERILCDLSQRRTRATSLPFANHDRVQISLSYLSDDEMRWWSSRYRCTQSCDLSSASMYPRASFSVSRALGCRSSCRSALTTVPFASSMVTTARSCVDFGSRSRTTHCRFAGSKVAVQRASGWALTAVCTFGAAL